MGSFLPAPAAWQLLLSSNNHPSMDDKEEGGVFYIVLPYSNVCCKIEVALSLFDQYRTAAVEPDLSVVCPIAKELKECD